MAAFAGCGRRTTMSRPTEKGRKRTRASTRRAREYNLVLIHSVTTYCNAESRRFVLSGKNAEFSCTVFRSGARYRTPCVMAHYAGFEFAPLRGARPRFRSAARAGRSCGRAAFIGAPPQHLSRTKTTLSITRRRYLCVTYVLPKYRQPIQEIR
jgi:hypothetical protein